MIKFILDSDSGQLRVINLCSRQISIWAYHGIMQIYLLHHKMIKKMPFESRKILKHCKSLFLHCIPKSSILYNRVLVPSIIIIYDVLIEQFFCIVYVRDCMCCYSLLASVAALCKSFHAKETWKVAYTFVSYETVRCKSYLSSIPYSVIVNVLLSF